MICPNRTAGFATAEIPNHSKKASWSYHQGTKCPADYWRIWPVQVKSFTGRQAEPKVVSTHCWGEKSANKIHCLRPHQWNAWVALQSCEIMSVTSLGCKHTKYADTHIEWHAPHMEYHDLENKSWALSESEQPVAIRWSIRKWHGGRMSASGACAKRAASSSTSKHLNSSRTEPAIKALIWTWVTCCGQKKKTWT